MEILAVQDISLQEWNELVDDSDQAWLLHRHEWGALCEEVFGHKNVSFAVRSQDHGLVAMVPLGLKKMMGLRHLLSTGFGPGGVALRNRLPIKVWEDGHRKAVHHLRELAAQQRVDVVEVTYPLLAPAYAPDGPGDSAPDVSPGFLEHSKTILLVDLRQPEEVIWKNMHKNCRAAVRQSERFGVKVDRTENPNDIGEFYSLMDETFRRGKAKPIPALYYERIWQLFGGRASNAQLFFATHNGRRVAVVLIITFKAGALYLAAGSRTDAMRLRSNNLLLWHIFRWAKEAGIKWFEMGGVYPEPTTPKQQGLNRFKLHFGGQCVEWPEAVWVRRGLKHQMFQGLKWMASKLMPNR